MKTFKKVLLAIGVLLLLLIGAVLIFIQVNRPEIKLSESVPEIDGSRDATALSAFFGIDNSLPPITVLLSTKAPGKDGMPIVFSQEVDPATLEATDFEITTAEGDKLQPAVVTLLPANEEFELRTVLMIGELGDHPDNAPLSVEVAGELMTRSGQNLKGQKVEVTPLPEGPFISYAEYFSFDEDYPYVAEGRGCDCPREETALVVRAVWAGGVRAMDGGELGDNELDNFRVTMVRGTDTLVVSPYNLADLADNDNNTDLCFREPGIPLRIEVDANVAIDPRDDPNPKTEALILSRW